MSEVYMEDALPEEGWTITDDATADWAVRKIRSGREELEKMRGWYQKQLEALEKRTSDSESFFLAKLNQYFDSVPTHDTKTQRKYALPSGDLIRKKLAPKYTHDDSVLLKFLKENGMVDLVKTTESVAWSELKQELSSPEYVQLESGVFALADTGEVVPGITVEEQPDKFDIKMR